jgi:hypothetical protein
VRRDDAADRFVLHLLQLREQHRLRLRVSTPLVPERVELARRVVPHRYAKAPS